MAERTQNMTEGRPAGLIFRFALPLMAGNIFQQMYTIVDAAIVGQFAGVEALASMGAAEWPVWLFLGLATGITQGFSLLIAQKFGAGDKNGFRRTVTMSFLLEGILMLAMIAASQGMTAPLLRLLKTPEAAWNGAEIYMRILFGGQLFSFTYNAAAALLRAVGDGKTPLIAMAAACAVNIGLDLLFVAGFGWGIAGAAAATVIAQAAAAGYCIFRAVHSGILSLNQGGWEKDWSYAGPLLRLAAPMAFQNVIIASGAMVIQYAVNGFGMNFVAGFTATNKVYGILEAAAVSFGYAVATYCGQNYGAGLTGRIRDGVKRAVWMAAATSAGVGILSLLFGKWILLLFISGDQAEVQAVLGIGYHYLAAMACCLPVLYLLYVYRSALQGMGNTVIPMVSGIVEMIMRISACAVTLLLWKEGIYYAEPAAWAGACAVLAGTYWKIMKKRE